MVHDNFTSLLMHSEVSLPFKSVSFRVKDPLFYGNSQGMGFHVSVQHISCVCLVLEFLAVHV